MKVLNVHVRWLDSTKVEVWNLVSTLSSSNDLAWPKEKWPRMYLDKGLIEGSKGGHGPIRYTITEFVPEKTIVFQFSKPKGFNGYHKFELHKSEQGTTIIHTIKMSTSFVGYLQWCFAIRWLHDALIEDAFDKIENTLMGTQRKTRWNSWVRILRSVLK